MFDVKFQSDWDELLRSIGIFERDLSWPRSGNSNIVRIVMRKRNEGSEKKSDEGDSSCVTMFHVRSNTLIEENQNRIKERTV